ncbi:MAG TPA: C1 family peptidase [Pseudobdellovibrionaceae bacterium]|jgi:C1A family cysteine protease
MKTFLLNPLFIVVLFITSSSWAGSLVNVSTLNKTLQKQKATWVAKENWLTQLSKSEAKRMMGLRKTPPLDVQFVVPLSMTQDTLPPSLDWRNKDGRNWVSPILNQGNCGSCVAFAAIGVMETQLNISSLLPNLNIRLSPQHLFSCGDGACNYGWMPESAASQLVRTGVTDEACMPYTSGASGKDVACQASCSDLSQRIYKISDYNSPTESTMDVDAIKRALQKGPLMTSLNVYADFMSYAGGVYKHVSGDYLGGHAISIVGYDDVSQSFIIRNSWGDSWGEEGFGHISYEDTSGVGEATWGFDIPTIGGAISLTTPRDYTYMTGTVSLSAESTFNNTDGISYAIYGSNSQVIWSGVCQGPNCSVSLDSSKFQDGRYEIQALATNAHGDNLGASTKQFFYIVNQTPELKLSFTGLGRVDLSKPLKGRIEFSISAQSSGVPMSSLEFHYKDPSGKETVRVSNVVLDQMTTGWRTNLIPNGRYEIWMIGRLQSNSFGLSIETSHSIVTIQN